MQEFNKGDKKAGFSQNACPTRGSNLRHVAHYGFGMLTCATRLLVQVLTGDRSIKLLFFFYNRI